MGKVVHQLLLPPAAWLPCALDRRLASASVSSKAIIAILSKTRPIARMVLLPVRLFVRPMQKAKAASPPSKPMNSRRCKPKDHAEYSRSKPCIAAKAARSCSVGVKMRKTRIEYMLSGFPPIADISGQCRHFRLVPESDVCTAANTHHDDHLVGESRAASTELQTKCP